MTTAYLTDSRFAAHTLAGHAEHAGRLAAIQQLLDEYGLLARMASLVPTPASDEQLRVVHTDDYLDLLAWTEKQKGVQLGPDTYVLPV
jgi:acetoin utilization deacetylase AcuC-like enzyme